MESATQLLESAGYTKHSDGYYLHMSLLVFSDGTYADGAKVIKTQLAQIGVGATIEELEEALGWKRCSAATMICASTTVNYSVNIFLLVLHTRYLDQCISSRIFASRKDRRST